MTEKSRQMPLFWRVFITFFAVIFVLIAAVLILLWNFLGAYELAQPYHAMDGYIKNAQSELQVTVASLYFDADAPYDDKIKLADAISTALIGDGTLEYAAVGSSGDAKIYRVDFESGVNFSTVTLVKDGDAGFGMSTWAVGNVDYAVGEKILPASQILTSRTLTVTAPEGSVVKVGDSTCEAADAGYFDSASPFNTVSEKECRVSKYTASPVYLSSEAEITLPDGNSVLCDLSKSDSADVCSNYYASIGTTYTITVPSESTVEVGDVALDNSHIDADNLPYPESSDTLAAQINAASGETKTRTRYTVDGLLLSPEVTVTDENGTHTLTGNDGVFDYGTAVNSEGSLTVTVSVPDGAAVTMNGVAVGAESAVQSYYYADVESLTAYVSDITMMTQYTVAGLFSVPDIEVTDAAGIRLEVTGAGGVYTALPRDDGSIDVALGDTVKSFAVDFLNYTAAGNHAAESDFTAVIRHFLTNAEAYKLMYAARFSFEQNIPYTVLSREITLRDIRPWSVGGDCFSVTLDMVIKLKNFRTVTDTITGMELFYVKSGGEWKIARMVMGENSSNW